MRSISGWVAVTARLFIALGFFLWAAGAQAGPISIDGSLSDWGFFVGDNNTSTFTPAKGLNVVGIAVQDTNDSWGTSKFLGPGRGGQDFDVELLAAVVQGGNLYVAMVSGQRPDNGFTAYGPGDFVFNTSGGIYGLEVGGGKGGGSGTAITEGAAGSIYSLDSQGFVNGEWDTTTPKAGSVWFNPTLLNGGFAPALPVQILNTAPGTFVTMADYIFTRNSVTKQHSIIEFSLPLTAFDGNIVKSISYAPACDNNHLIINLEHYAIPEPTTLALGGIGLAIVTATGVRRRRAVRDRTTVARR
ncbi:MAG: PEP-CTERM sorting domain-containing protein [Pirellulales bacterium]|nr:PEP-CTERM sorting domain-containing protein [Pirellulales bacterium]